MARFGSMVTALAMSGAAGLVGASPCQPDTLAAYLATPGLACDVGGLTFSAFVVEDFPGTSTEQLLPATIGLIPAASGFGLEVERLLASAGDLFGLRFGFRVAGSALAAGEIALGPVATVSGDGVITALLDAGAAGNAIAIAADGIAPEPARFTTAPSSFFDVFVEIGVDAGPGGHAAIGPRLAEFAFAPIPEPPALGLMLLGLAGLGLRQHGRAQSAG